MAIDPAAISASPAVTTNVEACGFEAMAPEIPAARANGTVSPSDIPMTTSRTDSGAVKWCSVWGVAGISGSPAIKNSLNDSCFPRKSPGQKSVTCPPSALGNAFAILVGQPLLAVRFHRAETVRGQPRVAVLQKSQTDLLPSIRTMSFHAM